MHPDLARFVEPGARPERPRDVGGRDAAGLDIGRVAQAAELPALFGLLAPRLEPRDIGELQRVSECRVVVAGVIAQRDRRLVRKLLDEIAPANLDAVDPQLARGGIDQPLHDIGRLGTPGAAEGVHGRGMGKYRRDFAIDRRRRVLPGEQRRVKDGRNAGSERREIRPHVGGGHDPHRQEFPVLVERELGLRHVVAAMRVGLEGLDPLRSPLDRAVQLPGRPREHHFLSVEIDLGAEAAADVGRDHAHLVLGKPQHERRHQQPLDVGILAGHVERVGVVTRGIARDRRARLDRVGDEAVVDEFERCHVVRRLERSVHRGLVAERPDVAGVVRRDVVNNRCTGRARASGFDHRRQYLVIDLDQLGGVLRLIEALGDDDRNPVADVTHLALREGGVGRLLHRLAVDSRNEPAAGKPADLRRCEVLPGECRDDAGRRACPLEVHAADARVRVGRAQEIGVRLTLQREVIRKAPVPREEAVVLLALDRLSDDCRTHLLPLRYFIAAAPASTALTIL